MRGRTAGAALLLALAGCTGGEPARPAPAQDPVVEQLLAAADRAAESSGDEARRVQAVRSTHRAASALLSRAPGGTGPVSVPVSDVPVWVVVVSGGSFRCRICSIPPGAQPPPPAPYLGLVLRVDDGGELGITYFDSARPLETLGAVRVLRG